jgi:UDP-glucose 4-epimerase
MRLLMTGASGFIGRNVLLALPQDWEVTAVYHQSENFDDFITANGLNQVTPVRADLTASDGTERFSANSKPYDACLYLAANGDPAVSVTQPAFDLQANCLAVVRLLEQSEFDRFVYFSSGAVYDGLRGDVDPSSRVAPRLPYAISKLAAERYLSHFVKQGRIGQSTSVRFFGAYGPHEPARKIYSRLVKRFGIEGNPEFTIRGDGSNLIDAMYVDDAVAAILPLLDSSEWPSVMDLACGRPVSLSELVRVAATAFGLDPEITFEGEVPEYIEFRSADRTFADLANFDPQTGLTEGLHKLREFLVGKNV